MNAKNIVGVSIVAAILYYGLTRKKLLDSVIVSLAGVKFDGTWLDPKLLVQLRVNNPTPFTQTITRITGNIYLNDAILIGEIIQDQPQTIQASNFNIFELPVNVNFKGIINTVSALIKNRSGKYTFIGSVVVGGLDTYQ